MRKTLGPIPIKMECGYNIKIMEIFGNTDIFTDIRIFKMKRLGQFQQLREIDM